MKENDNKKSLKELEHKCVQPVTEPRKGNEKELTFTEGNFLDASRATISFKELNTLDCLWHNLREKVVSIKNESLEHLSGGD